MIVELLVSYFLDERFLCQVAATFFTFCTLRIILFYRKRNARYQLFKYYGIPGPELDFIHGNLMDYRSYDMNVKFDEKCRRAFGDIYGIFIGDEPTIVVSNLEILKKVFLQENQIFTERSPVFIESPIARSILFAPHARWKLMRRILTPAFNRYKVRGETSTAFVEESIRLMLEYIDNKRSKVIAANEDLTLDIQSLMKAASLFLISSMAVKLPDVEVKEYERTVEDLDRFMHIASDGVVLWAIKFPFLKGIFEFVANNFEYDKTLGAIRRNLDKMIQRKAKIFPDGKGDESASVMDVLINLHLEGKMTRDEVIGNAEAILIAGYDTTSTTLTYVFWVLSKHPEIQHKLRENLMAHGTESEYLEKIIFETLRLYPTVTSFITRCANKTVTIDGLTIPQGCRVMLNNWLLSRDPKIWEHPLRFDPSRFDSSKEIHPCAFAPFGVGDRKCLGYKLAMLEMKMIICDMILRYRFSLVSPQEIEFKTHAVIMTMPSEKVVLKLDKL